MRIKSVPTELPNVSTAPDGPVSIAKTYRRTVTVYPDGTVTLFLSDATTNTTISMSEDEWIELLDDVTDASDIISHNRDRNN